MRLFFWDFNDVNDIQRQWAMFALNFLAVIFTTYCLIRTAKFHGKVLFELLPLSINTIATIMLLFIKLFEKGYQFDLVAFVIEVFTYFLFCYTFSLLHAKILQKKNLPVQRVCNGLLLILGLGVVIVIILVMTAVIEKRCDNNMIQGGLACLVTELLSYIPTMYFGLDILKNMKINHQKQVEVRSQTTQTSGVFETISDQFIKQRKNQIKLVLLGYTVSLILRGIVLIFDFNFDNYFICTAVDNVYILTSDQVLGQILLVVIQINQLIPHLIIPIALFVIPVGRQRTGKINLESTLLEEQDEQENDHGDVLQRRISRSIVRSSKGSFLNNQNLDFLESFDANSPNKGQKNEHNDE